MELVELPKLIVKELSKVLVGRELHIKLTLATLLAEGHVLIEGYPGTAKTLLAKAFAKVIKGSFKRIQFTPDVLPTDVTGFYMYTLEGGRRFIEGPLFANIVLADELNRATPKTQSALIEAMQERGVTIEGVRHELPYPFMIIATQLPYGHAGTYPLTEVQLDRFFIRLWSDYLKPEEEVEVVSKSDYISELPVEPVVSAEDVGRLVKVVKGVYVDPNIVRYIVNITNVIRGMEEVALGPSPRASIHLYKLSRALAFINGRDYVIPDDVKFLAPYVLTHRLRLKPEYEVEGIRPEDLVVKSLNSVEVPK